MEGQLQVDLPHAGALGEMSDELRNYWDVWLTIADAGVPWACLRLDQRPLSDYHQAKQSLSMVLHTTTYVLLLRVIMAMLRACNGTPTKLSRVLWISMTMFSGGWNIPRAHVIAEGSSLCLSLVMQLLLAITLCSIPVLAISDDENSMHGDWAITLLRLHRMARASMQ